MCINNNHAPFHLWWIENLVKHQKFSKYYDHDCTKVIIIPYFKDKSDIEKIAKIPHVSVGNHGWCRRRKHFDQSLEIKENGAWLKSFGICFFVIFDHFCKNAISERDSEH